MMQTLSTASFAAAGRHRLLKASLTPVVLVLLLCQVVAAMPTSSVAGASLPAAGLIAATALGGNSRQKRPSGREGGIQPLGLPVCAERGSL
jgi:hypothetical protein